MRKDTLALVAAIGVLSCAEAPTEVGRSNEERLVYSTPSLAVTAAGQILQVAIPNAGNSLAPWTVLVATGRAESVDISECDGNSVTVARYAVLTGARGESYRKVHFSTDVEAGTKMSEFNPLTSCLMGGMQYNVYEVETQ